MKKEDIVKYWLVTAERDWQTVQHLFESGDYHWSLFIGHLVIEKVLKAIYVQKVNENPPRIHDLARLAQRCDLIPDDTMLDKLDRITRYNLNVRYPDYQLEFYQMCTQEYTQNALVIIQEVRAWLLNTIRTS